MKFGKKSSPPPGRRSAGVNRGAPGGKSWGTATTAAASGTQWRPAGTSGDDSAAPSDRDRWTWAESDHQREHGDGWLNTWGAPTSWDGDERRRD